MRILELEQNTEEWETFRRTKIGASEAGCICGVDPYKKPEKLFNQKYLGEKQWVSPQMKRGKDLEPIARLRYEKIKNTNFYPFVALHDNFDYMMASFDGYNNGEIIEIKCPSDKTFNGIILKGDIPRYYIYQMNHQMIVAGVNKGTLIVFNGLYLEDITIERDEAIVKEILEKESHFYDCMLKGEYT